MITLTMNGKRRELPREMSVAEYLASQGIDPRLIAVEHNGRVLRREELATQMLRANDIVEIVRMMGGG